jgi:hypothetical protein
VIAAHASVPRRDAGAKRMTHAPTSRPKLVVAGRGEGIGGAGDHSVMLRAVRIRTIVIVSTMCLVVSCKKSEPAPAGAASAAPAEQPAAAAAAAPGSLAGFEGDITLLTKSKKSHEPTPITLTVKGAKMRFDVPEDMEGAPKFGMHTHAIVNTAEKKAYTVVDEQRMVMVMDLDRIGEQMKKMKPAGAAEAANEAPPKVTKTGHTDTVAGMKCEDWDMVNAKGKRGKVCVSEEEASFLSMPNLDMPTDRVWAKELFDGKHLPLRMVSYDTAGTEETRLEVTKLERKPVPDTVFEIPAGYKVMDFGQMMAGMGMLSGVMGGAHGSPGMPSGLPPGLNLPPGMAMPSGMALPPGMTLPKNAAEMMKEIQERAKAAGIKPPPAQP